MLTDEVTERLKGVEDALQRISASLSRCRVSLARGLAERTEQDESVVDHLRNEMFFLAYASRTVDRIASEIYGKLKDLPTEHKVPWPSRP